MALKKRMETILIIGIAGFIGANVRYYVSLGAAQWFGTTFPWGTLLINFSGSFLLGMFTAWFGNRIALDPRIRLFIAVGFFGAYTTFSTYANESIALFRSGERAIDRKSTRLNSSHSQISYAVFCLK